MICCGLALIDEVVAFLYQVLKLWITPNARIPCESRSLRPLIGSFNFTSQLTQLLIQYAIFLLHLVKLKLLSLYQCLLLDYLDPNRVEALHLGSKLNEFLLHGLRHALIVPFLRLYHISSISRLMHSHLSWVIVWEQMRRSLYLCIALLACEWLILHCVWWCSIYLLA